MDWNDLHDSLITTAEMLGDCMSKFTTLVRACNRSRPLVRYCHFGVSVVNYSDSDSAFKMI